MRLELNLDFEERFAPDRFFFGVAYAPYREGGGLNDPDGRGASPPRSTDPTDPPAWDGAALDHYADMVETVIDHGMQPIVTLHHFTHPLWLGVDIWLEDRGPDSMVDAQVRIVDEINQRLMARGDKKYWTLVDDV